MVAVLKSTGKPQIKKWSPDDLRDTKIVTITPDKAFSRFWQFSNAVRRCTGTSALRDIVDHWWVLLYDGHPPSDASFDDICLYICYELVYRDSSKYSARLTEKFRQNYEATRLLFSDRDKARGLLLEHSTTYYLAEKSGGLLSLPFSTTEEEGRKMAVLRKKAPPRLSEEKSSELRTTKEEKGIQSDVPPPRLRPPSIRPKTKTKERKSAVARTVQLLLERAHTDEELAEILKGEYPDRPEKNILKYIRKKRARINNGEYPEHIQDEKMARFFRTSDGSLTTERTRA